MTEELYNMPLHKIIKMDHINIMRVPGGWWYMYQGKDIFVQFDAEFKYTNLKYALSEDQIVNTVSAYYYNHFRCPRGFHKLHTRKPIAVEGKQMIAKLLKDLLELKQVDIQKALNYKERSSITHALKEMNKKIDENLKVRDRYIFLMEELHKLNKN